MCGDHPEVSAEALCLKHRTFICMKCVLEDKKHNRKKCEVKVLKTMETETERDLVTMLTLKFGIADKKRELETHVMNMREKKTELKSKIEAHFNTLRDELQRKCDATYKALDDKHALYEEGNQNKLSKINTALTEFEAQIDKMFEKKSRIKQGVTVDITGMRTLTSNLPMTDVHISAEFTPDAELSHVVAQGSAKLGVVLLAEEGELYDGIDEGDGYLAPAPKRSEAVKTPPDTHQNVYDQVDVATITSRSNKGSAVKANEQAYVELNVGSRTDTKLKNRAAHASKPLPEVPLEYETPIKQVKEDTDVKDSWPEEYKETNKPTDSVVFSQTKHDTDWPDEFNDEKSANKQAAKDIPPGLRSTPSKQSAATKNPTQMINAKSSDVAKQKATEDKVDVKTQGLEDKNTVAAGVSQFESVKSKSSEVKVDVKRTASSEKKPSPVVGVNAASSKPAEVKVDIKTSTSKTIGPKRSSNALLDKFPTLKAKAEGREWVKKHTSANVADLKNTSVQLSSTSSIRKITNIDFTSATRLAFLDVANSSVLLVGTDGHVISETKGANFSHMVGNGRGKVIVLGRTQSLHLTMFMAVAEKIEIQTSADVEPPLSTVTGFDFDDESRLYAITGDGKAVVVTETGTVKKTLSFSDGLPNKSAPSDLRTMFDFSLNCVFILDTSSGVLKKFDFADGKTKWAVKLETNKQMPVQMYPSTSGIYILFARGLCLIDKARGHQSKVTDTSKVLDRAQGICVDDKTKIAVLSAEGPDSETTNTFGIVAL